MCQVCEPRKQDAAVDWDELIESCKHTKQRNPLLDMDILRFFAAYGGRRVT